MGSLSLVRYSKQSPAISHRQKQRFQNMHGVGVHRYQLQIRVDQKC